MPSNVDSPPVDSLDVPYLLEIWQRYSRPSANHAAGNWWLFKLVLEGLGLPLEETLQYLGRQQPSLSDFEHWIRQRNDGEIEPLRIERLKAAIEGKPYRAELAATIRAVDESEAVLSPEDLSFWKENGYVVLHDAINPAACRASELAVWEFLQMDPNEQETWYGGSTHGIMRQFFHHPTLRANRGSPRVHKAFAQIWGTADLWATVDRVSFNPPERFGWQFPGPRLHWDTTLAPPIPFDVSGLIYLTDTEAEQGAFTCVPGFHRHIERWLKSLSDDVDPRREVVDCLGAVAVSGRAGDLIIWHKALPHGSRPNRCDRPRIVQYVSMHPADLEHKRPWK